MSKQQLEEATARVEQAGLAGRITLLFCDYRELPGTYDKVPPACCSTWALGRRILVLGWGWLHLHTGSLTYLHHAGVTRAVSPLTSPCRPVIHWWWVQALRK